MRPPSHESYLLGLLLAYPDAAHDLVDEVQAEDFTDTTERLLWEAIRPLVSADPRLRSADLIAAIANADLRTIAEQLLAARDGRPEGVPGPIRREIRDTLKEIRREAHDLRFRQLQIAIAEANFAGDRETLGALTGQLVTLLAARRAFDPPPSPYFHDTRTVVEKR